MNWIRFPGTSKSNGPHTNPNLLGATGPVPKYRKKKPNNRFNVSSRSLTTVVASEQKASYNNESSPDAQPDTFTTKRRHKKANERYRDQSISEEPLDWEDTETLDLAGLGVGLGVSRKKRKSFGNPQLPHNSHPPSAKVPSIRHRRPPNNTNTESRDWLNFLANDMRHVGPVKTPPPKTTGSLREATSMDPDSAFGTAVNFKESFLSPQPFKSVASPRAHTNTATPQDSPNIIRLPVKPFLPVGDTLGIDEHERRIVPPQPTKGHGAWKADTHEKDILNASERTEGKRNEDRNLSNGTKRVLFHVLRSLEDIKKQLAAMPATDDPVTLSRFSRAKSL